jgi:hypothetical protein
MGARYANFPRSPALVLKAHRAHTHRRPLTRKKLSIKEELVLLEKRIFEDGMRREQRLQIAEVMRGHFK